MPYQWEYYWADVDGVKTKRRRRIWIPEPAKDRNPEKNAITAARNKAARERAARAAAAAAAVAAAAAKRAATQRAIRAAAAEKAKQNARAVMWQTLQQRAVAARNLVGKPQKPNLDAQRQLAYGERADAIKLAQDKRLAEQGIEHQYQAAGAAKSAANINAKKAKQVADLAAATATKAVGTKAAGAILERLLAEAKGAQDKYGGAYLDTVYIQKVWTGYEAHLKKIHDQLETVGKSLDDTYQKDKHGNVIPFTDIKAYNKYKKILEDNDALLDEAERLWGKGPKDPGTLIGAQSAHDQIAESQRIWIRQAAKAAFFRGIDPNTGGYKAKEREWENREKWWYEATLKDIDPATTSMRYDPLTGKLRHNTVEEEFTLRQTQMRSEMTRQYNEWKGNNLLRQRREKQLGDEITGQTTVLPDGRVIQVGAWGRQVGGAFGGREFLEKNKDYKALIAAAGSIGQDPSTWGEGDRNHMIETVKIAMDKWKDENRHWFEGNTVQQQVYGSDQRDRKIAPKDQQAWFRAQQAQEKQFYAIFHAARPDAMEAVMNLPVAGPVLQGLQAFASLPGVLHRMEIGAGGQLAAGLTGVNKGALFSQPSKLFGISPTVEEVPPEIKHGMDEAKRHYYEQQRAAGLPVSGLGAHRAEMQFYDQWLKSPDGQKWWNEKTASNRGESFKEDKAFLEGVYGSTDLFQKMQAISNYGGNISRNPFFNMLYSMATDPTIAMPLKATTWMDRLDHAMRATEGMNALSRIAKGAVEFQHVNESTLKWAKGARKYDEMLAAGKTPAQVEEAMMKDLQTIYQDKDLTRLNREKKLRDIGINPRLTSAKAIMTDVQQQIVDRLYSKGVDYESVAMRARTDEVARLAEEKAAREATSPHLAASDLASGTKKAGQVAADEAERARLAEQKAAERVRVQKLEAKNAEAAAERARQAPLERQAAMTVDEVAEAPVVHHVPEAPLERKGPLPQEATGPDPIRHPEPSHVTVLEKDPLRRVLAESSENVYAPRNPHDSRIYQPDAAQQAADSLHMHTGYTDSVSHYGVSFAPGDYTDQFFASRRGQIAAKVLSQKPPDPYVTQTGKRLAEGQRDPRYAKAVRGWEHRQQKWLGVLYEASSHSFARRERLAESLNQTGDVLPMSPEGGINFLVQTTKEKKSFQVAGGKPSWEQHIVTPSELTRGSPVEQAKVLGDVKAMEGLVRDLNLADAAYEAGKIDDAKYYETVRRITETGVERNTTNLLEDLRSSGGTLQRGMNLEDLRAGASQRNWLAVGKGLVEDLYNHGDLRFIYQAFSLLPEMMKGAGYQTTLMARILNGEARRAMRGEDLMDLLGGHFAIHNKAFLGAKEGYDVSKLPSAMVFRQEGSHLFALFHMTVVDAGDAAIATEKQWDRYIAGEIDFPTFLKHAETIDATQGASLLKAGERKRLEGQLAADLKIGRITQAEYDAGLMDIRSQMVTGSMERLREYGRAVDEALTKDPHNIYLRMWKLMETHQGLWWADDFAVSEQNFIRSIMEGGYQIHPTLAEQMIRYGPVVRHLPVSHGYVGHLRHIATWRSVLNRLSGPRWVDKDVTLAFEVINDVRTTPKMKVQKAFQIMHYITSHYGSAMKRSPFTSVPHDFAIRRVYELAKAGDAEAGRMYSLMKQWWIDDQMGARGVSVTEHGPHLESDLRVAVEKIDKETGESVPGQLRFMIDEREIGLSRGMQADKKRLGDEFDAMFDPAKAQRKRWRTGPRTKVVNGRAPKKGLRPQYPPEVRQAFEDAYWRNKVTHDNPGLHTTMFLYKMGDPTLQSGDDWRRFAESYWNHMKGAGYEDMAHDVIAGVLKPEMRRAAADVADGVLEMGKLSAPKPGVYYGKVMEFFINAGFLRPMEEYRAELRQRVARQHEWNEIATAEEAMRDDLMMVDDATRERSAAFAREQQNLAEGIVADVGPQAEAMYDFATIDHIIARAGESADRLHEVAADVGKLVRGVSAADEAAAEAARLTEAANAIEVEWYRSLGVIKKDAQTKAFLKKPPKELVAAREAQAVAEARVATLEAQRKVELNVTRLLQQAKAKIDLGKGKLTPAEMREARAEYQKWATELSALREGPDSPARMISEGLKRPGEERLKEAVGEYMAILHGEGGELSRQIDAQAYLESLPESLQPWVEAETRRRVETSRLTKMLNAAMRKSIDVGGIPGEVGEDLRQLVDIAKTVPGGHKLLQDWADWSYSDLLNSRMIDYLKHEEWFNYVERVQKVSGELAPFERRIKTLRSKINKLPDGADAERARLEGEYDIAVSARDEHIAATRVEGAIPVKERAPLPPTPEHVTVPDATHGAKYAPTPQVDDFVELPGAAMKYGNFFEGPYNHPDFRAGSGPSVFFSMNYGGLFKGSMSKIHVAGMAHNAQEILRITDSIAREMGISYKWVKAATEVADGANFGKGGIQQGKFITAYPPPVQAREFAERLDEALRAAGITNGHVAPSERRFADDSPITHRWVPDARGDGDRYAKDGDYAHPEHEDFIGVRDPAAAAPTAAAGGAVPPPRVPRQPTPEELNHPRIEWGTRALKALDAMSEDDWLAREMAKAQRIKRTSSGARKSAAQGRINTLKRAMRVIEASRSGDYKAYTRWRNEKAFVKRAQSVLGERAKLSVAARMIAPYVATAAGLEVEQVRSLYRMYRAAPINAGGAIESRVRNPGVVSATYVTHGAEIEKTLGRRLSKEMLRKYGFPPDLMNGVSMVALIAGQDEFTRSLAHPKFNKFMLELTDRADQELFRITGEKGYQIENWLDDRLVHRSGTHMDIREYERLDQELAKIISAARDGEERQTRLDLPQAARDELPEEPLAYIVDREIRALVAKNEYLVAQGYDPAAYNEARKVFRGSWLKKKAGRMINSHATQEATRELQVRGVMKVDPSYAELFQEAYDRHFLDFRDTLKDEEAVKLLGYLAKEMNGESNRAIIEEFERRFAMDHDIKGNGPNPLTPFQQRSIEEAIRTLTGVKNIDDPLEMRIALSAHGQAPPFSNRQLMRDYLVKYGFWSPRTREIVESGRQSWSIQEEAAFFTDSYEYVPPWSDPDLLREGGEFQHLVHDEVARGKQFREWGLFDDNMVARFKSGEMSAMEQARFLAEGDLELELKAARDLPTERKYIAERYGDLAVDEKGNFIAFPELMNREELATYVVTQSAKGAESMLPETMVQSVEELALYWKTVDVHVREYFEEISMKGKGWTFPDVYEMTSRITRDILRDPLWLSRPRDAIGNFLRRQALIRRAFVMMAPGFGFSNMVDTLIKGPLAVSAERSWLRKGVSEEALGFTEKQWGWRSHGQLLQDEKVAGTERISKVRTEGVPTPYKVVDGEVVAGSEFQKRFAKGLQYGQGFAELAPEIAGKAEMVWKMRLAQGMYDSLKAEGLKRPGWTEEMASLYARNFARERAERLWPTMSATAGPYEKLWNQLFPFSSYIIKNNVVVLGEFASHPAFFNYLDRIGDYIEGQNRQQWAIDHPNEGPMPANVARLLELPWAPGLFIDLGNFTDIQRGLKSLYQINNGTATVGSLAGQWGRFLSPNDINIGLGILNAFHIAQRKEWVNIDGVWSQVEVPWEAPWSDEPANALNAFWFVEFGTQFKKAMESNFSVQEVTKLAFRAMFFGSLNQYDQGRGFNDFYYALLSKDPNAAREFLATRDGAALQAWWLDRAATQSERTRTWFTPPEIENILHPKDGYNKWFADKDPAFVARLRYAQDGLKVIRQKWDNILADTDPSSDEWGQYVMQASTERWAWYNAHPELYEYDAFQKSPGDWAKQLDDWQTQDLAQVFFNIVKPEKGQFSTEAAFDAAMDKYLKTTKAYLDMFPQVKEYIGNARTAAEAVWKQTEQHWFDDVLTRIGTRKIAIEAAKQSKNYNFLDQLYLSNELDYAQLNADTSVDYFNPATDLGPSPRGGIGPREVLKDPLGRYLIPKSMQLQGFTKWRYDRMDDAGKAQFERQQRYVDGMKGVIATAKASGKFDPVAFVRALKADPWLREEYFRLHPGKREQWAASDQYFKLISHYGILAKQGRFVEAGKYFDNLPDWVKSRYYRKHPEKRARLQENLKYMGFMKTWTDYYRRRDYSGGAAFFDKLPQWVKDRYYAKHPDGFGKGTGGGSPYAKAMGNWVKLLQDGRKDEAQAYFNGLPQAFKDRYYAKHPEAKLRADVKHTGQLADYFSADDANRAQYLKDNPEFAKWLKEQGNSEQTRRMLIMAGYQAIDKGNQWLKRIYREKYPEIFSKEAAGERAIAKVFSFLNEHPEMTPAFQKWYEAVLASYAEELKHSKAPPKPLQIIHQRQHGMNVRAKAHGGKSASWVRMHSLS